MIHVHSPKTTPQLLETGQIRELDHQTGQAATEDGPVLRRQRRLGSVAVGGFPES